MPDVERQPLAPLDSRTTIAPADRGKVYDIVKRELDHLVNGSGSYHPDGARKSRQTIGDNILGLKNRVESLQSFVSDPSDILRSVLKDLDGFHKAFAAISSDEEPKDNLDIPLDFVPGNPEHNSIDPKDFMATPRPDFVPVGMVTGSRTNRLSSPGFPGTQRPVRYVSRARQSVN
jgi:hypothetical protein